VKSSVTRRPSWLKKHGAFAAIVVSALFAIFQLAQPLTQTQIRHEQGDVSIAIDGSRTMLAVEDECEVRFHCGVELVNRLLPRIPAEDTVSLVSFDSNAKVLVPPTLDRNVVEHVLDGLEPGGNTALESAIEAVLETTRTASARHLVVFSDGNVDVAKVQSALDDAADAGLKVSTVLVGSPEGYIPVGDQNQGQPVFDVNLQRIAEATGGTFVKGDLPEVEAMLANLEREVTYETVEHPIEWPLMVAAGFLAISALLSAWLRLNRHL
jgi:Ca-activated chloride channel family protein